MSPYQLMPNLSKKDRDALRSSIEAHGVQEPIVYDQDGNVVDGHHRKAIAEELGIEYPSRTVVFESEAAKREMALTLNTARRGKLSPGKRREIAAVLYDDGKGLSQAKIATLLGVTQGLISQDLDAVGIIKTNNSRGRPRKPKPEPETEPEPASESHADEASEPVNAERAEAARIFRRMTSDLNRSLDALLTVKLSEEEDNALADILEKKAAAIRKKKR